MKHLLKSLLFIFATMCALPAFADDPCKNLFDGEYISVSNDQKAENKNPFYVTPGQKYTASWATGTTGGLNVYAYDDNDQQIGSWTTPVSCSNSPFTGTMCAWGNGETMTIPANVSYLVFNTFGTMDSEQKATWAASLQIERGDTATTYQPYNPLCTTCDGTVKQSQNLANFNDVVYNSSYFSFADGVLTGSGSDANFSFWVRNVQAGDVIRISANYTSITHISNFQLRDSNNNPIVTGDTFSDTGTHTAYWTAPANGDYRVNMRCAGNDSAFVARDIMIEIGDKFTPYHPYGTTYCEHPIKIATTAYNDAQFAPVEAALETAVTTIKDVVANTIVQADAIQNLQDTKQTMPDASGTNGTCPRFRQCLLIETDDGTPQWFQIADPVYDLISSLKNNKVNSSGETTSTAFAANGYDGTNNTTDSRYYKGYPAMRLKTSAQSSSVYTRQFVEAGLSGNQYKTLGDQEWAVTWDGNETGTANSFLPGVIYGTSKCAKTQPSSTAPGTTGWTTIENSDALNDLEHIEEYIQCYCKMTGVGLDGMITPVKNSSAAPWVFGGAHGSAGDCANRCAYYCAYYVRERASFRSAVLGWAVE